MKKAIYHALSLAFCASVALGFTSCSDDDDNPVNPTPGPDPVVPVSEYSAEAYYAGDLYEAGTGNVYVAFISNSLTWDDENEEYTGNGKVINLDFNTTLAENPDFAELTDGTYTVASGYGEFTINTEDEESFVVVYTDSEPIEKLVKSGTVTVSTENGLKKLVTDLTLADDSKLEMTYTGNLKPINRTGEGNLSNLTSDVTLNDLTQGAAIYFGETFTPTSDYVALIIAGKDYDLDQNYGASPAVNIGLNVTPGSNGIPSGTYTLIDANEADDYDVNTALSGVFDPVYSGYFGTWYFATLDAVEAAMTTGTVTVVNNGDGTYKITFDLKDGYGHSVKGTYSGAIAIATAE